MALNRRKPYGDSLFNVVMTDVAEDETLSEAEFEQRCLSFKGAPTSMASGM